MNEKRIDFILNIIEGIVCLLGVVVFSIAGVEVNEMQRFLFIIADFYCAIKLANCIDGIIGYFKNKKKSLANTQQIEQIMYWS